MAEEKAASERVPLVRHTSTSTPRVVREPPSPTASVHPSIEGADPHLSASNSDNLRSLEIAESNIPGAQGIDAVASPTFSNSDTLATDETVHSSNTGGRARYSWRGGTSNFWHRSIFLSDDPDQPAPGLHPGAPVELPKKEEPRSFFDSDSDKEESPIVRQASTASRSRPRLVEYHSSESTRISQLLSDSYCLATPSRLGPSQNKVEQLLGTQFKNIHDLTPATDRDIRLDHCVGTESPRTTALNTLTANAMDKASTTALTPTPLMNRSPSPRPSFVADSVIEIPATPPHAEALATRSSQLSAFDSLRTPNGPIDRHLPVNGLRLNPVDGPLHRTISAPPVPRRNRKVAIQSSDIDTSNAIHRYLRENIVSTPYPTRNPSFPVPEIEKSGLGNPNAASDLYSVREKTEPEAQTTYHAEKQLIFQLSLAAHPLHVVTAVVDIDKTAFDDEFLFRTLKEEYRLLLGLFRRFLCARTISGVHFEDNPAFRSTTFQADDFLKHFTTPKVGRKRKVWCDWLHRMQKRRKENRQNDPQHMEVAEHDSCSLCWVDEKDASKDKLPGVTFTHSFSVARVAAVVATIMFLSALVTVLWVLFGVPGAGAAAEEIVRESWRKEAGRRVLAGAALGLLTLGLGSVFVVLWIGASWILL